MELIKVADIPRSTYYYWEKILIRDDKYAVVNAAIQSLYHEHKGHYGYRRIAKELKKYGFYHDPKTINKLMNAMGIKCEVRMKNTGLIKEMLEKLHQTFYNVIL